MFLVCTRAESPPGGFDLEAWTTHTREVSNAVYSKVGALAKVFRQHLLVLVVLPIFDFNVIHERCFYIKQALGLLK